MPGETSSVGSGLAGIKAALMLPLSTEYAIREAVKLLRASRRNFKSRQVELARELLEMVLAELPPRPEKKKSA